MLIEMAFRRPEFCGGQLVKMADGTSWYVPQPKIDLDPSRLGTKEDFEAGPRTLFGFEFDRLVDACNAAGTDAEMARALMALAIDLMGRNYDLSPDQYGSLLRFVADPDDGNESLLAIYRIATGQGPRTMARWCRLGAIMAGVDPDRIKVQDAYELAQIQVALGRFIPADQWVEEMVEERKQRELDNYVG